MVKKIIKSKTSMKDKPKKTTKTKKIAKKMNPKSKSMVRIPMKDDKLLAMIGYKNIKEKSSSDRKKILTKGIDKIHKKTGKSEGSVMREMIRKLNVLSIYQKNMNPQISKMFKSDQKFVSKMYKDMKEHKSEIKQNVKMMRDKLKEVKKSPEVKHHVKKVKERINEYKQSLSNTNKQKIRKDMMKIKKDIKKIMEKFKK